MTKDIREKIEKLIHDEIFDKVFGDYGVFAIAEDEVTERAEKILSVVREELLKQLPKEWNKQEVPPEILRRQFVRKESLMDNSGGLFEDGYNQAISEVKQIIKSIK